MKFKNIYRLIFVQFIGVLIIGVLGALVYVNTPYKAKSRSVELIKNNSLQLKINNQKFYYFSGSSQQFDNTFLIYPGGRVEAESYAILCKTLAQISQGCLIQEMPLNFAFMPHSSLSDVINNSPLKDTQVTVVGHSLGGPFLARDLKKSNLNELNIDRMILLGSFSDVDISDLDLGVYSFVGENDLLIGDSISENINNLPGDTEFIEIPGGNHANWGDYGNQNGDGESEISNVGQINIMVNNLSQRPQ